MIVDRVEVRETEAGVERSARVRFAGDPGELTVHVTGPRELIATGADASPFAPLCLLPAMRLGEDLEIDGPVSPRLLHGCAEARRLYAAWAPELRGGEIRPAAEDAPAAAPDRGLAAFFSRGVDSTYSAITARPEPDRLDRLVFADGLEPVHEPQVRAEEARLAGELARRVGVPLALIATNLRELTDPLVRDWEDMAGGGLACLALSLGGGLRRVIVPASDGPHSVGPCGVSPLLDPLFSTEAVEVRHDSVAVTRVAKAMWLGRERPDLAAGLKVCYAENRPDNCGRCSKCLITMCALEAVGALEAAEHFPHELDASMLADLQVRSLQPLVEWSEVARALDGERHRPLREAILAALGRDAPPYPGPAMPADTPAFRRRHGAILRALVRDGRPWPPFDGSDDGSSNGALVGLVRTIDRRAARHLYGAGNVPAGELVGELGALSTSPGSGTRPVWLTPEGYVTAGDSAAAAAGPAAAARWAVSPLAWRDAGIPLTSRVSAVLRRAGRLAAAPRPGPSSPTGAPLGHVHVEPGDGRLPLHSAIHPVTGDQLLTTDRWEAVDLGYGEPRLLGYMEASAPVTGRLGVSRPLVPWAARFGLRVRG